jgi:FlaA1/EpsC-like NDP-sugar epimerase
MAINGTNFPTPTKPASKWAGSRRIVALALIYGGIAAVSFYLAYEIRFDFLIPENFQQERLRLIGLAVALKILALIATRQLGSMVAYFSIPDLMRMFWGMVVASALLFCVRFFGTGDLVGPPRGVLLTDFMLCFGGLCMGRLATRVYRERVNPRGKPNGLPQQRIAIVGAGDAGASLAKEFINAPSRGFRPVVFFDDDTIKHGKLVHGVPVVGRPETFFEKVDAPDIAKAIIAMPSASAKRVRELLLLFTQKGIKVETLPSLEELASGRVRASRVRPVEVQDLLGREAVNLDSETIRKLIEGRVALVTGAGGSIGSELCRQIAALNPKRLLLVEQAEGALFNTEQELNELGLGGLALPLVADILDAERMNYIFSRYEPEVVFHAAAHKHVYLMERQPAEAVRNNVLGTRQLAKIAAAHGVDSFVFISTDKAINPTSVMGATKRLAEIQLMAIAAQQGDLAAPKELVVGGRGLGGMAAPKELVVGGGGLGGIPTATALEAAVPKFITQPQTTEPPATRFQPPATKTQPPTARRHKPTKFMAVRFGNVLGSSGSVIPIFKRQIANGGPVTVTHPDVTRYFMTIPEAVGLVLQSFAQGKGGEIFVLDMGQPVKIVDLARQMIELSGFKVGDDIEISFTGLKPGEKLFEELQHHTEEYAATEHPRIMRFKTNAMFSESGVHELEQQLYALETNEIKAVLRKLVPEYTPFLD